MRRVPTVVTVILAAFLFLVSTISGQTKKEDKVVKNGYVVSLEYTLSDDKGKIIESNKGKDPLTYTQGQGQLIPGLEKELMGLNVGSEKNVKVKPEEGYGPIDPKAFREVPRENLPPEALKVGTTLVARNAGGQGFPVRVHEIKEKTVVLDLNHPLAGKTLTFAVKVLDVKPGEAGIGK